MCWEKGEMGSRLRPNITDVLVRDLFPPSVLYLPDLQKICDFILHIQDGLSANGCSEYKEQSPC